MLLSFLIIASGWWHIRAAYGSDSRQFYISKPLTMLLIIALAFGYQGDDHNGSHAWILLGLCLSLAGDVLLMLPRDRFIQGLAAFFVAHLCYIVGFAQGQAELATHPVLLTELSGADKTVRDLGYQKTKALIRQYRPDVVHIHQTHNRGIIEACLETTPTIIHGHDYRYLCPASTFFYRRSETLCARTAGPACFAVTLTRHCLTPRPQYTFPYYPRVRWIQQQRHRFAHVIAPSESCRQRFLQAGFAAEQVTTLPYFCPIPGRDEPRPLPAHPTLLFIGRTT